MNNDRPEYTEEYSKAEKSRRVLIVAIILVTLFFAFKSFYLPWIEKVSSTPCYLSGSEVKNLLYFLLSFVFLMLLIPCIFIGRESYKIIRDKQNPHKTKKTWFKTKIIYGRKAIIDISLRLLFILAILVTATVYGYSPVTKITTGINLADFNDPKCPESNL